MRLVGCLLVGSLGLYGCIDPLGTEEALSEGGDDVPEDDDGPGDNDDCKIEGDAIGREGVQLQLGTRTITFHDWIPKAGEPNEYVGFSVTIDGGASFEYVVKAGTSRYSSSDDAWLHPDGMTGKGISNVDGCDDDDDDDDDDDPPTCDNPDGCPDNPPPTCDNPDGCGY